MVDCSAKNERIIVIDNWEDQPYYNMSHLQEKSWNYTLAGKNHMGLNSETKLSLDYVDTFMVIRIISTRHVETVVLLSNKNRKNFNMETDINI